MDKWYTLFDRGSVIYVCVCSFFNKCAIKW